MEGLEITSNGKSITIISNGYYIDLGYKKISRRADRISCITLTDRFIEYFILGEGRVQFDFNNDKSDSFIVKSVNGVIPTDLEHLYSLILDII